MITGGASGIGLATARRLAGEGMRIVLADIEPGPLDAAVREIETAGVEALGVLADVGELAQVQALADQAFARFGAVHLLFNNAGVAIGGPIQAMSHADWEWLIRVNLWGVIHGIEAFVPRLIEQNDGGHIVSTASFAGLVPNQGLGVYCVTKYGVVALSETLYRDLSAYGIGVSVLCPMRVSTNIDQSARNRPSELGGPQFRPEAGDGEEPDYAGRTIDADEVAALVVEAVKANQLYIHTHPEARGFVRRRFGRIDRAFAALEER